MSIGGSMSKTVHIDQWSEWYPVAVLFSEGHQYGRHTRPYEFEPFGTECVVPDEQLEDWKHVLSEFARVQAEMKVSVSAMTYSPEE
jgi:hypothetical protein